jgi:hypothetical protein
MHAIPGGFINLITTEIYSRSGSGERRGEEVVNVCERPGQDLAKNRDPVQNLIRESNSNFLTFRSELGKTESRRGPYRMTVTETQSTIPFVSFAAFCSNPLRCLLLSIDSKRFGRRSNTDIGRCIWLHHFKPQARRQGRLENRRIAEDPTG